LLKFVYGNDATFLSLENKLFELCSDGSGEKGEIWPNEILRDFSYFVKDLLTYFIILNLFCFVNK
jgi:hypothetical protein